MQHCPLPNKGAASSSTFSSSFSSFFSSSPITMKSKEQQQKEGGDDVNRPSRRRKVGYVSGKFALLSSEVEQAELKNQSLQRRVAMMSTPTDAVATTCWGRRMDYDRIRQFRLHVLRTEMAAGKTDGKDKLKNHFHIFGDGCVVLRSTLSPSLTSADGKFDRCLPTYNEYHGLDGLMECFQELHGAFKTIRFYDEKVQINAWDPRGDRVTIAGRRLEVVRHGDQEQGVICMEVFTRIVFSLDNRISFMQWTLMPIMKRKKVAAGLEWLV